MILKLYKEKQETGFLKGLGIIIASDFSKLTLETRKEEEMPSKLPTWDSHTQLNSQSNISVIKTTSDMQGLRKFASHLLFLRKLLESVFQKKGISKVGGRSGVHESRNP